VIGLVAALNAWQTRDAPAGQAPPIDATLLDGTPVALAAYRGRPLLLHFWATWCPVCNLVQGSIADLAVDHPVLTVAMDDAPADSVRAYLDGKGLDYPVIHDRDHAISSRYGIRGVPTTFVIDASGRIRFVTRGYTPGIGLHLRLWWVGLTGGP
jgi:peroxiredoxin